MKRRPPDQTQEELDVRYWEGELLAAVARHDAAMEALHLASDECYEMGKRLTLARERLSDSRRLPTIARPPVQIHPNWRTDKSA